MEYLGLLILAAFLFQAVGFMVRDELWLRVFVLMGTLPYVIFYIFKSPTIYSALAANSALAVINIVLITVIVIERTTFSLSERDKALFEAFHTLSPGQFRRLSKTAQWQDVSEDMCILDEGAKPDRLYYVMSEQFKVTKMGVSHAAVGPAFAGEVAFLTDGEASASVTVEPGTTLVSWTHKDLHSAMDRSLNLRNALTALFSADLAGKVRRSVPA